MKIELLLFLATPESKVLASSTCLGKKLYSSEFLGFRRINIFLNPRAIADTSKSWPTLPTECIS